MNSNISVKLFALLRFFLVVSLSLSTLILSPISAKPNGETHHATYIIEIGTKGLLSRFSKDVPSYELCIGSNCIPLNGSLLTIEIHKLNESFDLVKVFLVPRTSTKPIHLYDVLVNVSNSAAFYVFDNGTKVYVGSFLLYHPSLTVTNVSILPLTLVLEPRYLNAGMELEFDSVEAARKFVEEVSTKLVNLVRIDCGTSKKFACYVKILNCNDVLAAIIHAPPAPKSFVIDNITVNRYRIAYSIGRPSITVMCTRSDRGIPYCSVCGFRIPLSLLSSQLKSTFLGMIPAKVLTMRLPNGIVSELYVLVFYDKVRKQCVYPDLIGKGVYYDMPTGLALRINSSTWNLELLKALFPIGRIEGFGDWVCIELIDTDMIHEISASAPATSIDIVVLTAVSIVVVASLVYALRRRARSYE